MEVNITQKKKHLLLLNRIMRTELKKDIIPTPSKLPEEEVKKYFERLFVKKDDYYVPIKSKVNIKIDEELFKGLIKKPKMKEVKQKEEVKEDVKPKEEVNVFEMANEFKNIFDIYDFKIINENLYKVTKVKFDEQRFKDLSYRTGIFQGLVNRNHINDFIKLMKQSKIKKEKVVKPMEKKEEIKNGKEEEEIKNLLKGKIKFNVIGK